MTEARHNHTVIMMRGCVGKQLAPITKPFLSSSLTEYPTPTGMVGPRRESAQLQRRPSGGALCTITFPALLLQHLWVHNTLVHNSLASNC